MKEMKNLKGEIVKVESSDREKWWQLSISMRILFLGLILFNIGFFIKLSWIDSILHVLDVRLWPWEILTLLIVLAVVSFQYWRIHRDWDEYFDYEKKHARNFIALSVTVLLILCCLFTLSLTGRFSLFFRPVVNWFARGNYTLAALWRSAIMVISFIPLIYFGKEWICGFWDE